MHCSVWRFTGDPEALERGYLAIMERVPEANHVLHAAARTPDGLLIFDTCPSEEAYRSFFGSEATREVKAAGVKASGLTERQYDVLRERVETYVRLNGRDGGGTQYIFTAGELETLAKHADALRGKALEESYWDPRSAAEKRS